MKIRRHFTVEGKDAYDGVAFRHAVSEIRNPDGSVVFKNDKVEAPEDWSQVAIDVLAQKYFRKAGVAAVEDLEPVLEKDVPGWLWRHVPKKESETGGETSAKQVFDRLAGTWTYWGWKGGYFSTPRPTRGPFSTRCVSCWRARCPRRTRRNGSTPGCIGPMASTGRARATTMSTSNPAS